MAEWPEYLLDETAREEYLTRPSAALQADIKRMEGRLILLGAGGKMGPTLASLAARARQCPEKLEILAVSRFSDPAAKSWLEARGIKTLSADLLDANAVKALPDAKWVISLAGRKFGTNDDPSATWAVNCLLTSRVCERYGKENLVALSTGNVYPMVSALGEGSVETDPIVATGEYSAAAIGRERMLQYYSLHHGVKCAVVRLNYAVDMVYGVLVDIGQKVLHGEAIDLSMGHLNCIWQRDANEAVLRLLLRTASPMEVFNLTGPKLSVRQIAIQFGKLLSKEPLFKNTEGPNALLSNSGKTRALLGEPETPIETVLRWTAKWLQLGKPLLNRPTKFQIADGKY